jgi:6-phosphofructokinase 1
MTFGFQSAVDIATNTIDCIHTTATSHSRVFIVEIMGHKVGWVALHAGIAGGADIILLPEIPYDLDKILEAINKRTKAGKQFTIIAVAEGAISKEEAKLPKKEFKEKMKNKEYPSIAYELAAKIQDRTEQEVRITIPGHMQRGGSPCPYDRVISTRFGAAAAELILNEEYGYMVGMQNGDIVKVPLSEVAGKLKMVNPEAQIIQEARLTGISFGD